MITEYNLDEILAICNRNERIKALKAGIREKMFTRAVDSLECHDRIRRVEHIADNVWACTLNYDSWAAIAAKFSMQLPGIVMPTRNGIIWICGGNGPHGVLLSNAPVNPDAPNQGSALDHVIDSRRALLDAGYKGVIGWTMGGMSKRLLKHVCEPQFCPDIAEKIVEGINPGYYRCIPGVYDNAFLYDVSSYYYTFLTMLDAPNRSLVCAPGLMSITWGKWKDGEREKYRQVLAAVKHCKALRNSLVGAAQGTTEGRKCYTRTETGGYRSFVLRGKRGPFRGLGLLIVRCGYELTQREALTNGAIYSIIDSVILTHSEPSVWPSYGFYVDRQAQGQTEIVGKANYKIGPVQKVLYRQGYRHSEKVDADKPARFSYVDAWL